ncbi:hypothetical protein [Fibrella aquatilis]|uniref:Uncharacterized protein n=1 Tax=Fibrella aquatilis TaxID=2817059 RepID=A0A939GAZ8_9BACT|nr:hypothetical protein [Fibrella aquatilis]MBO0933929.1 hypothetical protein [Fibrella aquatilis]
MLETAEGQTHVQELTNRNDHPQIDVYFRAAGIPHPERMKWQAKPYCVAFVAWVFIQCKVPLPKGTLTSVAAYNRMTNWRLKPGQTPLPADVVTYTIWSHGELVKRWPPDPRIRIFIANGGNTTAGNGRQGVYANIPRPKSIVRHIIRFIPET